MVHCYRIGSSADRKRSSANWSPAPVNLFDSKLLRGGSMRVDVDITGARELWLLMEDVDSYDPSKVIAGWAHAELIGPSGHRAAAKAVSRRSRQAP